jgi:hypothetical protein
MAKPGKSHVYAPPPESFADLDGIRDYMAH